MTTNIRDYQRKNCISDGNIDGFYVTWNVNEFAINQAPMMYVPSVDLASLAGH